MTEQELADIEIYPLQQYILSCSDRIADQNQNMVCGKISEAARQQYNVNAIICAQCMLNGTQDQTFINNNIKNTLFGQLHLIMLGFYQNHDYVLDIFRRAYQYSIGDSAGITRIANSLVDTVRLGRLTLEEADALITEIPELDI